jgi:hypothetical protein
MVMIVELGNIEIELYKIKTSPIFGEVCSCVFFTTNNLSDWRDNLRHNNGNVVSHVSTIWKSENKSKKWAISEDGLILVSGVP